MQQLTACLKVLGLELARPRIEQADGKKRYFYRLEYSMLEQVKALAERNNDEKLRSAWYESRRDEDDIAFHIDRLKQRSAKAGKQSD